MDKRKKLSISIIGILIAFGFIISPISVLFFPTQETGLRRVVLISLDSCNSDYLTPEYMPYLYEMLMTYGAKYKVAEGPVASETQGGHTVMLCGAWPNSTGIIGNGLYLNDTKQEMMVVTDPSYRLTETIFESLEPNTTIKTAFLSGKWRLRPLLSPAADLSFGSMRASTAGYSPIGPNFPVPDEYKPIVGMPIYMNPDGDVCDSWIINSLIEVVKRDDPDFSFVNLAYLDVAQHYNGPYNAMIGAKMAELDNLFKKLFTEFMAMGKFYSTLWIITADHEQEEVLKIFDAQGYLAAHGIPNHAWNEGGSSFIFLDNEAQNNTAYQLLRDHPDIAIALSRDNMSLLHLDTFINRTGHIYISGKEHIAMGKTGLTEFGTRGSHGGIACRDVPMAFMGPGIKNVGHEIDDHIPGLVDIMPTIANLTGWDMSSMNFDGVPLTDILSNSSMTWWS